MKKGFTLIELLVVIAVLAVLAAGVMVAINPGKRIRQANDAKIRNDVGQLATALQAYFTTNQIYPANLAALATSKDIKMVPAGPGGTCVAYAYSTNPSPCVIGAATDCEAQVNCALQEPLVTGNVWCWRSLAGSAVEAAGCLPTP